DPPRGRRQEYRTPPAGIAAQMPLGKHVHPGHLQGFSQPPLMSRKTFKGLYAVLAVVLLGAPAVLAAPAPALATPPHSVGAGVRPTASDLATVDAVTLCLVNRIRSGHHLRSLRANPALAHVAASQVSGMVRLNYFADVGPSGVTPQALIAASPYPSVGGSFT